MRPLRDFLVILTSQIDAIANVAHITYGNNGDTFTYTKLYQLVRCLMENIALLAVQFGGRLRFAFLEPSLALGAVLTVGYSRRIRRVAFVAQPFDRAQIATADDEALAIVSDNGSDINLTQIHTSGLDAPKQRRVDLASVDGDAQFIVVCAPGQLRSTDIGCAVFIRELQNKRVIPPTIRENNIAIASADRLPFPSHSLVRFGFVRIPRRDFTCFCFLAAQFARRLDIGVEFLRERLNALRMQSVLTLEHLLKVVGGKPFPFTALNVRLNHVRPASPGLPAQGFTQLLLPVAKAQGKNTYSVVGLACFVSHDCILLQKAVVCKLHRQRFLPTDKSGGFHAEDLVNITALDYDSRRQVLLRSP